MGRTVSEARVTCPGVLTSEEEDEETSTPLVATKIITRKSSEIAGGEKFSIFALIYLLIYSYIYIYLFILRIKLDNVFMLIVTSRIFFSRALF